MNGISQEMYLVYGRIESRKRQAAVAPLAQYERGLITTSELVFALADVVESVEAEVSAEQARRDAAVADEHSHGGVPSLDSGC
jgi:hypothetical protein